MLLMKSAVISVIFLCACDFSHPAVAQTPVGGPKRPVVVGGPGPIQQNAIGGPAPTNTTVVAKPVVPAPKVGTTSSPVSTAVVPPSPEGALPASARTTPSPTSVVKCAVKGFCVRPTKPPTTPSPLLQTEREPQPPSRTGRGLAGTAVFIGLSI